MIKGSILKAEMLTLRRTVHILVIFVIVLTIGSYFLTHKSSDEAETQLVVKPIKSDLKIRNVALPKAPLVEVDTSNLPRNIPAKHNTGRPSSVHNTVVIPQSFEKAVAGADDIHAMHNRKIENFRRPVTEINFSPRLCETKVSERLKEKLLNEDAIAWCKWALNRDGGGAVVGKSWGRLKKEEQVKFEKWNCNNVNSGNNPSCNDKWGDDLVKKWRKNSLTAKNIRCLPERSSRIYCYQNDNKEQFCTVENVKIDFTKFKHIKRSMKTDSKEFQQSYMTVDCNNEPPQSEESQKNKDPGFTLPHLFSTQMNPAQCDITLNGTTLLYSHDNIRNLGHTINDIMNVWLMLWLDKKANAARSLKLLSIDALKQYNNFGDQGSKFFLPYEKALGGVLLGSQYADKVVCLERMLVQPHPSRGFIWEGWDRLSPCNEVGPSSLAQRFNIQSRHSFGVLPREETEGDNSSVVKTVLDSTVKVLMIVRTEKKNDWGRYRSSRLYKNADEIAGGIQETLDQLKTAYPLFGFELQRQDMNLLSFEEQVRLVSSSSVMLGMHGAGIAMANYMSVGLPNCCGVLEIYPKGEFTSAMGHENMIRRAGISYKRIDVDDAHSHEDGAVVPVDEVKQKLHSLLSSMIQSPSCVLPEVMADLYLEAD